MRLYLSLLGLCLLLCTNVFAQKINLTSAMLSYYNGQGNSAIGFTELVDEQSLITGTLTDNSYTPHPSTLWIPSWGATPSVQVNLGSTYAVSHIALYDSWNAANLTVKYDNAGSWVTLFTWDMSYSEKWKAVNVNASTSKLLFEFAGLNAQIGEIAIFGSAASDTQAPTVPGSLSAPSKTAASVNLSWTASTDNIGVAGYEVYRNGTLYSTVTTTTASVTGLTASTAYTFKVRAKDAANNFSAFTSDLSVTTNAATDTQAPTVPSGLASSGVTAGAVTLSWGASTDNVGVAGYEVYRNGTLLTTVTTLTTTVTGLTASTAYVFKVRAKDAANNYSAFTSDLNVTTTAATDTQAPTVPGSLASSNLSATAVTLSWTASIDNVGVTGYEVHKDGTLNTTVTTTTATITGLSPSTTYVFRVRAKDAASNFSGYSTQISVTTLSGGPCTPGKLTLTASMISGDGNPTALLDEQTLAGDPAGGTGGATSTAWFNGWNSASYPARATLNFGTTATLSAIYLRDVNDQGTFTVEVGSPGNWSTVATDNLTGYMSWNQHSVNASSQYLRFTMGSYSSNVSEVVIYGCLGPVVPDTTPPGAITTLSTGTASSTSVQLAWTATGDDGNTGSASSYDVRYSTSAITAGNFASATQATGEPAPLFAGNAQSFFVSGLSPSTTYYFALKAIDEANNTSAISNVVSKATSAAGTTGTITIDQFIGTNAFVDDPLDKMQVAGFVREYHNWNWDEGDIWSGGGNWAYPGYPNNQIKWAPSEAGGGGWNFDTFYTNVLAGGITISPCIQGSVAWLQGGTNFPGDDKPVDEAGASTTNPNSYEKKAHHMFQFAARYGSTHVADNKLTLAAGQPRNTGMGLVKYVEDWNEQDKNWMGANAQFSAQEYAAMASANYDGHANTMHQGSGTFGVKNADPNMKLVMGGIFQLNLPYIQDMKAWFQANRADGKFAADVINVHDYAWLNPCGPCGGPAKSPEEHDYKNLLLPFTQYRDANLPGLEVWISEFGWDTNQSSSLRVPLIGPFDAQEVQGQWMVRAYLAFAAARVDRAMQYMLRDVNPNDATHFSTSGLVAQKNDWTPKKSWYYVYTLKNTLTGMVFLGEQATSDPNVLIYKFKSATGNNGAYVVWAKTRQNYTATGFSVSLSGSPTSATKVEMVPGDTDGVSSSLTITGGQVSINVSERPVFIKVNSIQ
ncbi:fibronectin type III domain-containing protein [Chryseolinea lacunae]|uniref:Fibronectin type III domain-containing protein n=1 Tax=Chryseolinea lacunae TaxID=2801331 RepID=A0ABS1KMC2_9BACT|nr:fibronectin type III domain-containing protein [Chryseolinea lacunae]MBL0740468.1 fibronectin type III domain-containing protein [Chryseolinea lacunae]